jgi:putative spermidine/putrescine transport system substrate-binding protein
MMDSPIITQAKNDGLVTALDPTLMPNLSDISPQYIVEDGFGVGLGLIAIGIAYPTKVQKPTSWADLWQSGAKRKVGVVDFTLTMGPMVLSMAGALKSGKKPEEAQYDPNSCFAGMKDLKPNINSFWTSDAQELQLAVSGGLWWVAGMTSKSTIPLVTKGLPAAFSIPKERAFALMNSAAIVKGSSDEKLAMKVLNLMLSPDYVSILMKNIGVAPTNRKVSTPPATQKIVPTGTDATKNLIQLDWKWITSQRPAWQQRWNNEIVG